MSLQKIVLSALSLATVMCIGFASVQAADTAPASDQAASAQKSVKAAALTKDEINTMIHDYIMNNPQVLMQSVEEYQKKSVEDRAAQASKDVNSPEAGNPKGDVTVVEFFDYNCHYCKGAFPAVQSLIEKDKKVRVVFKEFPILGPTSGTAAKWALAAQKQKKYFEFHAAMMNNKEPISDELLARVAKNVGMDVDKAKEYVASPDAMIEITKNRKLAEQLDLNGTPAFIIGGNISRGAISEEEMESQISVIRAGKDK